MIASCVNSNYILVFDKFIGWDLGYLTIIPYNSQYRTNTNMLQIKLNLPEFNTQSVLQYPILFSLNLYHILQFLLKFMGCCYSQPESPSKKIILEPSTKSCSLIGQTISISPPSSIQTHSSNIQKILVYDQQGRKKLHSSERISVNNNKINRLFVSADNFFKSSTQMLANERLDTQSSTKIVVFKVQKMTDVCQSSTKSVLHIVGMGKIRGEEDVQFKNDIVSEQHVAIQIENQHNKVSSQTSLYIDTIRGQRINNIQKVSYLLQQQVVSVSFNINRDDQPQFSLHYNGNVNQYEVKYVNSIGTIDKNENGITTLEIYEFGEQIMPAISQLTKLMNLRSLYLKRCNLTNECMDIIWSLKHLTTLDVRYNNKIDQKGFQGGGVDNLYIGWQKLDDQKMQKVVSKLQKVKVLLIQNKLSSNVAKAVFKLSIIGFIIEEQVSLQQYLFCLLCKSKELKYFQVPYRFKDKLGQQVIGKIIRNHKILRITYQGQKQRQKFQQKLSYVMQKQLRKFCQK